jgi:hypothetical protein
MNHVIPVGTCHVARIKRRPYIHLKKIKNKKQKKCILIHVFHIFYVVYYLFDFVFVNVFCYSYIDKVKVGHLEENEVTLC